MQWNASRTSKRPSLRCLELASPTRYERRKCGATSFSLSGAQTPAHPSHHLTPRYALDQPGPIPPCRANHLPYRSQSTPDRCSGNCATSLAALCSKERIMQAPQEFGSYTSERMHSRRVCISSLLDVPANISGGCLCYNSAGIQQDRLQMHSPLAATPRLAASLTHAPVQARFFPVTP